MWKCCNAHGSERGVVVEADAGMLVDTEQPRVLTEALEAVFTRTDGRVMDMRARHEVVARYDLAQMVSAYGTLSMEVLRFA